MSDGTNEGGAPYRGRLRIVIAGVERELPQWADWLMALGEWMRQQAPKTGKRVAVVRLPVRALAAGFVGLGALSAAARSHNESLDWDALCSLSEGTPVYWRTLSGAKSKRHTGRVVGLLAMHGSDCLHISQVDSRGRATGSNFYLPKSTALAHGVTLGLVSTRSDEKLTSAAKFMQALDSDSSLAWLRSPMFDSTVVTERAGFLQDIVEVVVRAGTAPSLPMLDALAVADNQGREHGKLLVVPARAERFSDAPDGVTILDGPAAVSKLGRVQARSVVVLIAHSEYDEEISHEILPFLSYSVDDGIHAWPTDAEVGNVPVGVDVFAFGIRDQHLGGLDSAF